MNQTEFDSAAWYHAVTLTERLVSLRRKEREKSAAVDNDLAKRRLERWRTQSPFATGSYFAQRLAMDNTTEDELLRALGESIEAVAQRCAESPAWLNELSQAFSRPTPEPPFPIPKVFASSVNIGFLGVIEPALGLARDRLRAGIEALSPALNSCRGEPERFFASLRMTERTLRMTGSGESVTHLPFDPETIEEILLPNLIVPALIMLSRTMVLELNVARLEEVLQGDTPEARFKHFLDRIRRRDIALTILQEYPVLARQLIVLADRWVNVSLEFLRRLCSDWEAIKTTLGPSEILRCAQNDVPSCHPERSEGSQPEKILRYAQNDTLTQLNGGAGDTHRGGRSVMLAKFSSGFRVVYKPKSLAVDIHFQELLNWLNERGAEPSFPTTRMLDRNTHGWIEFVETKDCKSPDEVRRFYERQGGYLALLYALQATDFHMENLIASGERPVLVDLESLFQPETRGTISQEPEMLPGIALGESVMRIGLLPVRIWSKPAQRDSSLRSERQGAEGIDISGLGAEAGQIYPDRIPDLDGVKTDEMRVVRKQMEMARGHNRPLLNGNDVNVLDYTDAIVKGFTGVYHILLAHRDELLSDAGPLARFAQDEVRVIVRPTRSYSMLWYESFHPDLLRDALDRDRFFDKLWVGIESQPYLARTIPSERRDLNQGDIPMLLTRPDSRDLWDSAGERIADFSDESGLSLAQRRLRKLNEQDLANQIWFIKASFTTLARREERAQTSKIGTPPVFAAKTVASLFSAREADQGRLLAAARAVGDRLEALALQSQGYASWLGLTPLEGEHWTLAPLGTDLYGGLPGLALFLGYLGSITQEDRYHALARATLATMRKHVDQAKSSLTQIGAFAGWGGIIFALTHLGQLWNEPALLNEAEDVVGRLPELVEKDQELDIIAGSAGCIGSLVALYQCRPSDRALAVAVQCGDWLIGRAQAMEHGIAWLTPIAPKNPLAGFAHGAAGMAWALLRLAGITGAERFQKTALSALDYERSLFSAEAGNWPDLREPDNDEPGKGTPPVFGAKTGSVPFMNAWCHGAPGIGLARLSSLPHLDDANIRAEIDAALKTTLAKGFGFNHSLCHGDLGNLELLMLASQVLDDPQWQAQVTRISSMILESIKGHGWLCGVPSGVETPGLMVGLAGIGYELLRLAEPRRVPSVLILDPPWKIGTLPASGGVPIFL
jgi:type 2 lantibiotic biosynthesis protein LanM